MIFRSNVYRKRCFNITPNSELIKMQMERQIFSQGDKVEIGNATLYNNDCVMAMDDIEPNSVGLIVTSIPFGNLYEYSDNYNDFGHNDSNEKFFEQMDSSSDLFYHYFQKNDIMKNLKTLINKLFSLGKKQPQTLIPENLQILKTHW